MSHPGLCTREGHQWKRAEYFLHSNSKEVKMTHPVVLTDMDYADGISLHSDNVEQVQQVLKSGVCVIRLSSC